MIRLSACKFIGISLAILTCASISSARSLKGSYEVPNNDPAKKGASIHPVELENAGDYLRDANVRFILPATLVGNPIEYQVSIIERAEKDIWAGPGIEKMECNVIEREYTCNVAFTPASIALNEPAIEKALKLQNPALSAENVMAFMSVSRDFADDPIGILRYEIRGKDRESHVSPVQTYQSGSFP